MKRLLLIKLCVFCFIVSCAQTPSKTQTVSSHSSVGADKGKPKKQTSPKKTVAHEHKDPNQAKVDSVLKTKPTKK